MRLNFDGKNWAVQIIFFLDMLFFGVAIALWLSPYHKDIAQKVWEVFMGANGALLLLLNAEGKKQTGDLPEGTDPTKVATTQKVEVTTTTDPTQVTKQGE